VLLAKLIGLTKARRGIFCFFYRLLTTGYKSVFENGWNNALRAFFKFNVQRAIWNPLDRIWRGDFDFVLLLLLLTGWLVNQVEGVLDVVKLWD
jgi:hypothetical protein